jgi:hypothetical protein
MPTQLERDDGCRHTHRAISYFDLKTRFDKEWRYDTLAIFAELSDYTSCTAGKTTVRDEMVSKLKHLWRARTVGIPNLLVRMTWDGAEKSFAEDMHAVLSDLKAHGDLQLPLRPEPTALAGLRRLPQERAPQLRMRLDNVRKCTLAVLVLTLYPRCRSSLRYMRLVDRNPPERHCPPTLRSASSKLSTGSA